MFFINATVLPVCSAVIDKGYVQVKNGKIHGVGTMSELPVIPEDAEVFDLSGRFVVPGFVDAHSHLGLWEDGIGFEGSDGNEDSDPITPNVCALDGANPLDRCFADAAKAGVTTAALSPGSANPISGQISVVKTSGQSISRMLLKKKIAIKFSLGENPKRTYHEKGSFPYTRMGIAAQIRDTLEAAREYLSKLQKWEADPECDKPEYDAKLAALCGLFRGECAAHFHAHRADDIDTAIRITAEFGLTSVIIHGTEGYLMPDALADAGLPVVLGPVLGERSKVELRNASLQAASLLYAKGIPFALCCDHPETPQNYLHLCMLLLVKSGLPCEAALAAVTLQAAKIAGVDTRVGSLAAGKDADFIVFDRDPFDFYTEVQSVYVGGVRL